MSNRTETRLLILIVGIYFFVVVASWLGRGFLFDWGQTNAPPEFPVILMWIGLILALLILVVVIAMKVFDLTRTKKYITLLVLSSFLIVVSLFGEFGWLVARYGIPSFIETASITLGYQPPLVPVTFTIDTQGNIAIQGSPSIATLIGTFSVTANVMSFPQPQAETLLLIVKHNHNNALFTTIYRIKTKNEKVVVITNGITRIEVSTGEVIIDASGGNIKSIRVEDAVAQ